LEVGRAADTGYFLIINFELAIFADGQNGFHTLVDFDFSMAQRAKELAQPLN